MKKITLNWWMVLGAAMILISNTACQESPAVDAATLQKIRGATVLIEMQSPVMATVTKEGKTVNYVNTTGGIGTVIQYQGKILLVTHNHWGEILQDTASIDFRDADNHLIQSIDGKDFKSRIVFQNAGTLILVPPDSVKVNAIPHEFVGSQIGPGAKVSVLCRERPAMDKAVIREAVVEGKTTLGGIPVYELHAEDGQSIQPGDSGGGIWYGDTLIGNNWSVVVDEITTRTVSTGEVEKVERTYSDESYAASLPLDLP